MWRRQEASQAHTAPAPVASTCRSLSVSMAVETSAFRTANMPAEAAALGRVPERTELDARHGPEERLGLVAEPERPERVAGRVIRQRALVPRPDVDDAEPVDEELRQLQVRPAMPSGSAPCSPTWARTWATHEPDGVTTARTPRTSRRTAARGSRDIGVAGVQVELAAAGLVPREDDLHPQPLEQRHGRAADGGIERVRQARDEERDAHGASVHHRCRFDRSSISRCAPATDWPG